MPKKIKLTVYYFQVDDATSAKELKLKQNAQGRWFITQVGEGSYNFWLDYRAAVRTFGKPYDVVTFDKVINEAVKNKLVPISEQSETEIGNLMLILEKKSKIPINSQHAMIKAKVLTNLDSFYNLYRFGLATAGYPNNQDPPHTGPTDNHPMIYYYAGEDDKIKHAQRVVGAKSKKITVGSGSNELDKINTVSPVPDRKKLKK
jgi:hypothetical protein